MVSGWPFKYPPSLATDLLVIKIVILTTPPKGTHSPQSSPAQRHYRGRLRGKAATKDKDAHHKGGAKRVKDTKKKSGLNCYETTAWAQTPAKKKAIAR